MGTAQPPPLRFSAAGWAQLRRLAEAAYPFEGCGLLLGPFGDAGEVTGVVSLRNVLRNEGRGRFDFALAPEEFLRAQRDAERESLDVRGIFHTHPDHPPRPSATDAAQPMLAGWVHVIAAVHGGRFKEAKAWWREDDGHPFLEASILVAEPLS